MWLELTCTPPDLLSFCLVIDAGYYYVSNSGSFIDELMNFTAMTMQGDSCEIGQLQEQL